MKNILKKLHIMYNQSENEQGSSSSSNRNKFNSDGSSSSSKKLSSEHKPFSGLSSLLYSVTNKQSPIDATSSCGSNVVLDSARHDSGFSTSRDPEVEEEYQIQLALELSAKEDPEAVQIEAVKQISLGSCGPDYTPAEVMAYRYWNYDALGYDDKILDGFYDLYGILTESTSTGMPSLVDLQGTPTSDSVTWEAVLVNRAADSNLLILEQNALELTAKSRPGFEEAMDSNLVHKLAIFVADYMGGPVGDPESMKRAWKSLSYSLKATLGSMVLPLGSLTIGLARHRALLFKVLADSLGIPCRLVKGQQYTGSEDVAINFVKIDDGREYIIDLMADPGALIPSDAVGSHIEYDDSFFVTSPSSRDLDFSRVASSSSGAGSSSQETSYFPMLDKGNRSKHISYAGKESDVGRPSTGKEESLRTLNEFRNPHNVKKIIGKESSRRRNHPHVLARSLSWTEGISSPDVHSMKVKDVSLYMIDAAKENPHLAQKLHDVLLESGVVAPPHLFSEIYREELISPTEANFPTEVKDEHKYGSGQQESQVDNNLGTTQFLSPLPHYLLHPKATPSCQSEHSKPVDTLGIKPPLDTRVADGQQIPSWAKYGENVPVAAVAAAAAAVVASSMVVAAAKSGNDSNIELPVVAAATATAVAVVASTAAATRLYEQGIRSDGDTDGSGYDLKGSGDGEHFALGMNSEGERISDRSVASNASIKSDYAFDDVAEYDIPLEEITVGERIGLGSYGEVYHGEWHGTEVAVKRFLDQDIYGESLEEFKSEVQIMKRLRHPNVVLFMGAVTRPPNLSIVTEFLPRGSLYRLLHRPNSQLDVRRRLRMALDARGMNYLHNCTPVIVHRDLKSPNLLVDKNWVVKVCDFGLSRIKHSTFLSSRSTAGTAEWMAPEVLRNEPSNEKCDVYSFGIILWELSTLQQPWGGMNPMQVVGAVGFQHRRLDIPDDMDPAIADIITKCWQTVLLLYYRDPKLRPTFAEIMAALKPLQKPIVGSQVPRPSAPGKHEKARPSQIAED
ncbi:PREDICTED: serine/threonine-protein kinase EDR1-like isoform X2 [Lupinus angustifolius]|uniref:serine/threonine-protein kinase EDR1-like isoform X2 n=1 Tax=Lupinus angustifolius TaxID=3871 RepID=UPI00092FD254|nr:PREDICTED: serine/threonine-protein kinase EDR1-like isoform X2 [Lupinus angustifolius]